MTQQEREVLEAMAGMREAGAWGAMTTACLEGLQAHGFITQGPHYRVTEAGYAALNAPADYQAAALMTINLDGVAIGSYAWRSTDGCWRAVMADGTILTDTDRNELERRMIECASK